MKRLILFLMFCLFASLYSEVDSSTLHNKIMMGYQGWFTCAGDGNTLQNGDWYHWGINNQIPNGSNLHFDMYPDLSEFDADELYDTEMTKDGSPALLYSSRHPKTVARHFRWMREYGIDGVFMQRFTAVVQGNPLYAEHLNAVLTNAVSAAETEGRVIAIMYDVTGSDPGRIVEAITNDWINLTDNMGVVSSDRYIKHNGKPVVGLWGFGFNDSSVSVETAQTVIDWFKTDAPPQYQATVLGGIPQYWREQDGFDVKTDSAWAAVFRSFDIISPWSVGRYKNYTDLELHRMTLLEPDKAEVDSLGIEYMPVVFPGFSWKNLHNGPFNEIPRDGGRFYWRQVYNAVNATNSMIYVAMFDEVDESTAMFKVAETTNDCPDQGTYLTLDEDGFNLSSDWYLQLANETGKLLRGEIPLTNQVPIGSLPPLPPPPVPQIIKVEYVSQDVPATMTTGRTYSVTVSMKNTGNFTWGSGGDFKLGSLNDDPTWGVIRVLLDQDCPSNTVHDFVFNVTAPSTAGTYTFQWRMVQENVAWFGPASEVLSIIVEDAPLPEKPAGLIDRTDEAGAIITSEHADSPSGNDVVNLFDNNVNTVYLTTNSSDWVQHQFADGNQYAVVWYSVTSAPEDPTAQSPNLVANPSFETGGSSPVSWSLGGSAVGSTDSAQDGSASLRITTADINATSQTVGIKANTDYTISMWIDASGLISGPAVFDTSDLFDGDGEGQFVINAANAGWTQYTGSFNSGANTSVTLRMFTEGSFNGVVYFDNVSVAAQNADGSERDPFNWVLSGSNDGSNWTEIDSRAGIDFPERSQTREFDALSNSTAYEYYRFDAVNNSGAILSFSEVELFSEGGPVTGAYETIWTTVVPGDSGTALLDDFDGDGRNNLYEYALDGDPENSSDLGTVPVFVKTGDTFEYVHLQRRDDPTLTYSVEACTDLVNGSWAAVTAVAETNIFSGAYDEVSHVISPGELQSYIRLKVEKQ